MTHEEKIYRIAQLDMALNAMGQYAEQARTEAENRARLAEWQRNQALASQANARAVPAANDPNNPNNWPRIGFNTEIKKEFVMSPGATVRAGR